MSAQTAAYSFKSKAHRSKGLSDHIVNFQAFVSYFKPVAQDKYTPNLDGFVSILDSIPIDCREHKYGKEQGYVRVDKDIMHGQPVISGTRITLSTIIDCIKDEMTIDEICEDFSLTKEQVNGALDYISKVLVDI